MHFDALLKRKKADDNRQRFNHAIVAAVVANAAPFGDPNRKALTPLDFVPDLAADERAQGGGGLPDLSQMEPVAQRDYLLGLFGNRVEVKTGG